MKTVSPIYPDPTNDDTIDMEIPAADSIANKILLGCMFAFALFVGAIIGACLFKLFC